MSEPRLYVRDDIGHRSVTISKSPFTIGRGTGNDLQIAGTDVSREHVEVVLQGSQYVLKDRGSRYGTFVNGVRVSEHVLTHGDRIECGRAGVSLGFVARDDATNLASVSGPGVGDLRQVSTLLNLLRQMGSERVIDEVLTLVLDGAIDSTGAERGFIMLADVQGLLEMKLARHSGRLTVPFGGFDTSRKIPEEVFTTGETRVYADLLEDGMASVAHTGTIALGIRQVLCAPLRLVRYVEKGDASEPARNIGVLYLDSRERGRILGLDARLALESLAAEAATAIEYARLYRGALEKARVDEELNTASRIQQALLPDPRRAGPFFEAVGASVPSRAIGGDFFDYQMRPENRFGFGLGDVTGKGPPAALLTSLVQGVLAAQAGTSATPEELLLLTNRVLLSRHIESRFLTLFLATLDEDGTLTYSNAGQNPPFLLTRQGMERLEAGGTLIGAFPNAMFPQETRQLEPGDTIVIFSDGVTDAMSEDGVLFGDERLAGVIEVSADGSPDDLLRSLFDAVDEFARGAPQQDDLTAVVVRYLGPPETRPNP